MSKVTPDRGKLRVTGGQGQLAVRSAAPPEAAPAVAPQQITGSYIPSFSGCGS